MAVFLKRNISKIKSNVCVVNSVIIAPKIPYTGIINNRSIIFKIGMVVSNIYNSFFLWCATNALFISALGNSSIDKEYNCE